MTLPECIEPFFLALCRLRRIARAGVNLTSSATAEELAAAIDRAGSIAEQHGRGEILRRLRPMLREFAEISAAQLPNLKSERTRSAEAPQVAEAGLAGVAAKITAELDAGPPDAEVLEVCRTLHALGLPAGEAERRAWRELGEQLRAAGGSVPTEGPLVTPGAYAHTDTRDLTQPASRVLAPMIAGAVGIVVVLALAVFAMRQRALQDLEATLDAIVGDTVR